MRRALKELEDAEFLIVGRQGGKNQCSLYALTCFRIDDCDHDLPPTSPRPRRLEAQALRAKPLPVVKAALRESKPPAWAVLHLV